MKLRHLLLTATLTAILSTRTHPVLAQTTPQPVQLTLKGSWPEFPRGPALGLDVAGNYAYVASDVGLQVIDVTDPRSPRQAANVAFAHTLPNGVRVVGSNAFVTLYHPAGKGVAGFEGCQVFDITIPERSFEVGVFEGNLVDLVGDHAFLTNGEGINVFDVSDPSQAKLLGTYSTEVYGLRAGLRYAYVLGNHRFSVLDVSDPARIVQLGTLATESAVSFDVGGGVACLAGEDFVVLDVSDPTQIRRLGILEGIHSATVQDAFGSRSGFNHTIIQIRERVAYVLVEEQSDGGSLAIAAIDFSDPENPVRVGSAIVARANPWGELADFRVQGRFGYVVRGGLEIIDLVDPTKMTVVGRFDDNLVQVNHVRIAGKYAFLADGNEGARVMDVSDPRKPTAVNHLLRGYYHLRLKVIEEHLYAGFDGTGFAVLDLSNPRAPISPKVYSRTNLWHLQDFDVTREYAYLSWKHLVSSAAPTYDRGLLDVLDVRDRANPSLVTTVDLNALRIRMADHLAFIVSVPSWLADPLPVASILRIYDWRDPMNPVQLAAFTPDHLVNFLDVSGNHAYIAGTHRVGGKGLLGSLTVIDVSNPLNPTKRGSYSLNGEINGIQVQGRYVLLSSGWYEGGPQIYGIRVIDVGDPSKPELVGEYRNFNGGFGSIDMVGNMIYAAHGDLRILELSPVLALASPTHTENGLTLSWNGGPGIRLQKTASLGDSLWQDVPGTEAQSTFILPLVDGNSFFRVIKP